MPRKAAAIAIENTKPLWTFRGTVTKENVEFFVPGDTLAEAQENAKAGRFMHYGDHFSQVAHVEIDPETGEPA